MGIRKRSFFVCEALVVGFLLILPVETVSKQVVPFGFCPKYNPRIMYQLYQPFVDYLNEATPYQFEIKLSRTYEETIDRLGRGVFVIASCGPVSYIKAGEKHKVTPILRTLSKDGKTHYRGIIFVRDGSSIQSLADLRGKSFAFGQIWSTAGHILPEYHLRKANIRPENLSRYSFLRHHDSVVNAVLKGQFDAGAVKDIIANQYREKGIKFIHTTDPIPTVPIIIRNDAPREMVQSVEAALLKLNPKDPTYQKKMAQWDEEFKYGFTGASDSDYDPIRKILRIIGKENQLKGEGQD